MMNEFHFKMQVLTQGFKSYADLARKAGIAPQTLNALIKGERKTVKHRKVIAKLLKVKPETIWDD